MSLVKDEIKIGVFNEKDSLYELIYSVSSSLCIYNFIIMLD